MRIGKCPKCRGEMFILQMNWNGWRDFKCSKCSYSLSNETFTGATFKECLKELKQ